MIYLLGASHIMAILDACAAGGRAAVPAFGQGRPPAFQDCPLRPGALPGPLRAASLHVAHTAPFWGPVLAELTPQGVLGLAPGFQALLAQANDDPQARGLFFTLRGEESFHLGLAGVDHPFDFVLPERPDLPPLPDRALLPLALVQERLQQQLVRTSALLTAIRKLCPRLPLVQLPPPPPAPSEDVAAWAQARDRAATEHAHRVPTSVRLKLWWLHRRALAQCAAGLGIATLPVPAEALHPAGTLRPEFMEDAIHGNARYGALVCAQMAAVVSPALETA